MVYPALTYLEEVGHATVEAVGARKLYHITDAGKEHLDGNRGTANALFAQFGRVGERMDRVRRAMRAEEAGEGDSEERREHERRGSKELQRARRELKAALLDKWDSPREEQQRIAEILKRAAAQILGR
jgi:DNA-binding PadR family transcriptional regulator